MAAGGKKVSEMPQGVAMFGGSIISDERVKAVRKSGWHMVAAMHHLRIMQPDILTGAMALVHKDLLREAERMLIQFEDFDKAFAGDESKVAAIKAVLDGMGFNLGIEKGGEVDKTLVRLFEIVNDE